MTSEMMHRGNTHRAQLSVHAAAELYGAHAAANLAGTRLQQHDFMSALFELVGGAQSGQSGAHDDNLLFPGMRAAERPEIHQGSDSRGSAGRETEAAKKMASGEWGGSPVEFHGVADLFVFLGSLRPCQSGPSGGAEVVCELSSTLRSPPYALG